MKHRLHKTWLCLALCAALLLPGCAKQEDSATVPVEPVATAEPAATQEQVVEIIITPPPTPAATPVPTPTLPLVVESKAQKGYTSKSGVNLRSQPSTQSDILDALDRAEVLSITGEAGDWYRVEVNGEQGFIAKEFVGKGEIPSVMTINKVERQNGAITASGVNMRKEPSTKGELIEKLDVFTHFTITGENEKWYEIEYDGKTGYVSKELAEPAQGYYESEDLYLVAQLVYQEAKYTTLEGKIAVANVVYNRIRSRKYPNTIEDVVFQKGQFSPADNESKLRSVRPHKKALEAVLEIFVRGETILPRDVLYFRAARLGTTWASSRTYYETYGGNCFFK